MVDLLDQIGFVFSMLKFFQRLFSMKGVFHLDLDKFVFYLLWRGFKPFVGFPLSSLIACINYIYIKILRI